MNPAYIKLEDGAEFYAEDFEWIDEAEGEPEMMATGNFRGELVLIPASFHGSPAREVLRTPAPEARQIFIPNSSISWWTRQPTEVL